MLGIGLAERLRLSPEEAAKEGARSVLFGRHGLVAKPGEVLGGFLGTAVEAGEGGEEVIRRANRGIVAEIENGLAVKLAGFLGLLLLALCLLPITPAEAWKPTGEEAPTAHILGLLLRCLGLPYLMLSATGPLLQAWFSRAHPGVSPYRLYALSNVGSLLALLG